MVPLAFSETVLQGVLEWDVVDREGKDTGPAVVHEEGLYEHT